MKLLTLFLIAGGVAGQTALFKQGEPAKPITLRVGDYCDISPDIGAQSDSRLWRCVDHKWVENMLWVNPGLTPSTRPTLTKAQLRFALISRVLTEEEMGQVEQAGLSLYSDMVGFPMMRTSNEVLDWQRSDLLQQFKLRLAAEQAKIKPQEWPKSTAKPPVDPHSLAPYPDGQGIPIPFMMPTHCEGVVCW